MAESSTENPQVLQLKFIRDVRESIQGVDISSSEKVPSGKDIINLAPGHVAYLPVDLVSPEDLYIFNSEVTIGNKIMKRRAIFGALELGNLKDNKLLKENEKIRTPETLQGSLGENTNVRDLLFHVILSELNQSEQKSTNSTAQSAKELLDWTGEGYKSEMKDLLETRVKKILG